MRDDHLLLTYRGATIRLEADDPRIAFIELLLFGKTLPPPLPAPASPLPPAPPTVAPHHDVPRPWVLLWKALPEPHRRVLLALSLRPLTSPDAEKLLGLPREGLRVIHLLIAKRAAEVGLSTPVRGIGRGREQRRYSLDEGLRPTLLELERRREQLQLAIHEAER